MRLVKADHLSHRTTEQVTDWLNTDGADKLNSSKERSFWINCFSRHRTLKLRAEVRHDPCRCFRRRQSCATNGPELRHSV